MEEEFRFHLDMEERARLRAGADNRSARRGAFLAFGGLERVKEEMRDGRGTRLLEDAASDLVFSLRALRHSPRFAAVAILTIAIGIGGTTAVFSAVDAVLLEPLPYQQPGQLVRLYQYDVRDPDAPMFVSLPHYRAYRTGVAGFDALAATYTYNATGADIGTSDRAERIRVLPVSADYFRVVGVQPVLGRAFEAAEEIDPPLVILSYDLWQRLFGGRADVLGSALTMSGIPRTICGVMPRGYADPMTPGIDAWTPLDLRPIRGMLNPINHYLTVVGRLRPGTTRDRAQAEVDALNPSIIQVYPDAMNSRARLVPLKQDLVASASRPLELMLGAVGLVLLLACVNVANLLLVRASERAREMALRAALGAKRGRLTRQLLADSVVLAMAGGVGGLALGRVLMPVIASLGATAVPRLGRLTIDWRVLLFTSLIASASALIFGLAPALRASQAEPAAAMRAQSHGASGGRSLGRLRSTLVVSQVALALVLLIGAGLLVATVERLRRQDLGVTSDDVLTFDLSLPAARYDSTARARFYEQFAEAAALVPGVRAAGGISRLPVTGRYHSWGPPIPLTGPLAGTTDRTQPISEADNRVVSGDYFRAVGMHVLHGRTFDARDMPSLVHHVVISASLAQQVFPGADPLGQRFQTADIECEVIGVVNDVAYDVEGHTAPTVYHAHRQYAGDRNWALTQVIAVNGSPSGMEGSVRRTVSALDPLLVMYQATTLDEVIGRGRARRVFLLRILSGFAGVALVLAGLGLFGVLSYAVRLRSKELGIRMALGADRREIRRMVLRDGASVTLIGLAIGLGAAVALSRITGSVVFGVSPLDPAVLGGASVFLALVAALAAYLPAHRASTLAPQRVLQGD